MVLGRASLPSWHSYRRRFLWLHCQRIRSRRCSPHSVVVVRLALQVHSRMFPLVFRLF